MPSPRTHEDGLQAITNPRSMGVAMNKPIYNHRHE